MALRVRWQYIVPVIASLLCSVSADGLVQNLCSPQNTGDSYPSQINHYDSLGSCDTRCQDGYAFAIVQGESCWCSNYGPGTQIPVSECSSTCPGYPYEFCGSTENNLFGYLQLSRTPFGTSYTTSYIPATLYTPPGAAPTTVVLTSDLTIVSTKQIVSTQVNTVSASPSTAYLAVTVIQTSTAIEQITVIPIAPTTRFSNSASAATDVIATSTSLATSTYIQRVTVSGTTQVVTELVTTTATLTPDASINPPLAHHSGISSGAAAGAAIGAILGLALTGAILYFCCCFRRSKRQPDEKDAERGLNRNTSVPSKVGLLRRISHRESSSARSGPMVSPMAPRLQTTGLPSVAEDPRSAATMTSATMSMASNSRPTFVDQRLNPNPWSMGLQANRSTSSIGSLRDYRDYSRPLEVRNPDPP